jgi:hypothetical protein
MSHELRNINENAAEFLILLCLVVNIVAISNWLSRKPRRFTLRGILIVMAAIAVQLWLFGQWLK